MENITFYIMLFLTFALNCYVLLFKEYSKEKGKNIATKQDIEEITAKIENVKLELSSNHSQRTALLEKHKLSLITFFEEYNVWYGYSIREISIVENIFAVEQMRIKIDELNHQRNLVEKSLWNLFIFEAEDKKFTETIKSIFIETDRLNRLTHNFLVAMEQNSNLIQQYGISSELASKRSETKKRFITERDEMEEKTIIYPNQLMNLVRTKYLKLFER